MSFQPGRLSVAQCGPGGPDSRGPGPAAHPEAGGPQDPLPPCLHRAAEIRLRRVSPRLANTLLVYN